jgi:DNA invertase Pin-like site-specific DNA recombinase
VALDEIDDGRRAFGVTVTAYTINPEHLKSDHGRVEAARQEHGGKCPWGGRKPGARVKVTEEVEIAIRDMLTAGKPIAEIARIVKVSRPTVYATLNRTAAVN